MRRLFVAFILFSAVSCTEFSGRVDMLSPYWEFDIDGGDALESLPANVGSGFTLAFDLDLSRKPSADEVLLSIPGVVETRYRMADPEDWSKQNYPSYLLQDGTLPVLESELQLQWPYDENQFNSLTVGIPLAILEQPFSKHSIVLNFDTLQWSLYVDDRLYDNDFAIGYPAISQSQITAASSVSEIKLFSPSLEAKRKEVEEQKAEPYVQYWSPQYHNAWVGDVAACWYGDRYHIFYLFDRRGHGSKMGRGGHYFEHVSTTDFKHWTEHQAAVPIDEQWETIGTGSPFEYDGKLYLSYGLHTSRICSLDMTTYNVLKNEADSTGSITSLNYFEGCDLVPEGATYSICNDGVEIFEKTGKLFHYCENPTVYTDPDGNLRLYASYMARGTWGAESLEGDWSCIDANFPPGLDCTFNFQWGDYEYIVGGFNRMWFREIAEGASAPYRDLVAEGGDFYNGQSVPAVTKIPGDRYITAGWLKTQPWGGLLGIHELVQFPDGRLGSKWMDEIVPQTKTSKRIESGKKIQIDSNESYLLSFDTDLSEDTEIIFEDSRTPGESLQWRITNGKASYTLLREGKTETCQRTVRERAWPNDLGDYAISLYSDGEASVRIAIYNEPKLRGTMLDAEIAACQTMLDYREHLCFDTITINGASVGKLRLSAVR